MDTEWEKLYSKSKGRVYFFNRRTGESRWDLPEGVTVAGGSDVVAVRARHILVKHTGSRNPSSWREAKITRSKEEALQKLGQIRRSIVEDGADFAAIAEQQSDCSSAKRGGDLGFFSKGQMQPSFERAAFALKVGEISDIVESDSGVHIIRVEETK
ncbi:hypothetical protein DFJ74DRAFT_754837 [Hyaloraphidium curvatum]|nr:hypothetical protein DFJ74DRAFT_754837 [Hyaloraphidium curvatum]